ncbi:MAG: hypothetical protein M1570_04260 [Chloroflexi bacterium]|nr:hypothetical protein [Chloroflexota bacterium]
MNRAPDWTIAKFEIFLAHNDLTGEQLAELLPRRTAGAIEAVRNGIHLFHTRGDGSMLSEIMRQRIEQNRARLICPVCKAQL